jgi:hypothetical protein
MKIDSRKFSSPPRLAERSQPAPAAARNTGSVPSAKRPPSDGFESATTRTARATAGNTRVTGPAAGRTKVNMDFQLDPSLEPHRDVFAKVGARIAKLPTEELRAKAIDRSSDRLAKVLNKPLDLVKEGLNNSVLAQLRAGPTTTNDPQECFAYRSDRILNHTPALKPLESQLKGIGLPISKDTSLRSKNDILQAAKPQLDQLGLQGRDQKIAERYILGLVREDRARTGALGGAQLPRFNSGTMHILPYGER